MRQMNPGNLPTRTSMPAPGLAAMGYGAITSDAGNGFGGAVIVGDAPEPVAFTQEQYEAMARGQLQAASCKLQAASCKRAAPWLYVGWQRQHLGQDSHDVQRFSVRLH
jgi:hypothetical protein